MEQTTKKYDKLVRDFIPDIIRGRGGPCVFRVADESEYWDRLKDKLREEVEEFCESGSLEELADIEEVLVAIREAKGLSREQVEKARVEKGTKRGAFSRRIILEEA